MPGSAVSENTLDPERLRSSLPAHPGVYLFKDGSGRVLYVGKAKNLKKRVLSYFKPPHALPYKTGIMMQRAAALDFIITSTENEAFILESNLVRKHLPRYNVVLRDDKRYPSLRLDLREPYPRLSVARKRKRDQALYFGPFSSARAMRSTMRVIDRVFSLRKCRGKAPTQRKRPCLNHQMGLCLGPCTNTVPVSEYRREVEQVKLFLEGRNRELTRRLREDMRRAAEALDFERAARIRDQIRAVDKTVEPQHVVSARLGDVDAVGLAKTEGAELSQVAVLHVRKGALMGSWDFLLKDSGGTGEEVLEAFLKQYYHKESEIPGHILISEEVEDRTSIEQWLSELAGRKVCIHKPLRGEKRQLADLAVTNAENLLAGYLRSPAEDLVAMTRVALKLDKPPRHIEGVDISTLHGSMAVGTIVSFVDGEPHREGYRSYRIRTRNAMDDYGMIAEVISRRLEREPLPDLFLIDGGRGQLSAAGRVLNRPAGTESVAVVSIAKPDKARGEQIEKLYIPGRKNPVSLRAGHPVLLFMMRIRDEAHRRAVSHHRRLREKEMTESKLTEIPGVGNKRARLLLAHFRDMEAVAEATIEELHAIEGISRPLAGRIQAFFRGHEEAVEPGPGSPA